MLWTSAEKDNGFKDTCFERLQKDNGFKDTCFERLQKDNGFKMANERNWRYPAQTITDTDFADDIAFLVKTLTQAKTRLHRLERAAGSISFHVNADTREYICFNQRGGISSLNGTSQKLVTKITYLGSSVSSTENNINTLLPKAWTGIDKQSVILKSDLTDKIKRSFI